MSAQTSSAKNRFKMWVIIIGILIALIITLNQQVFAQVGLNLTSNQSQTNALNLNNQFDANAFAQKILKLNNLNHD